MICLIAGIMLLLIGAAYFWLNLNSPIQTMIPFFTLPPGALLFVIGIARLLP